MKPYTDSPHYDESRNRFEHPAGYRNDKGLFDILGLAGAFLTREDDPAEKNGMPLIDPAKLPPADRYGRDVTWIGHALLLFQHNVVSVLTDPVFSDRVSPLAFSGKKRVVPPAYIADTLPKVDILIVSHAHYDHLDLSGLKRLAALQPDSRVVVPLGLARYLLRAGSTDVTEIDWWQNTERDGTTITPTPVRHWASRSPFDWNKTLSAGFMFRFEDGYQFYFAGDTGYSADFTETWERLGAPDFAAIPSGPMNLANSCANRIATRKRRCGSFRTLAPGRRSGFTGGHSSSRWSRSQNRRRAFARRCRRPEFPLTGSVPLPMASAGICNVGQLPQYAGCRGNLSPQNHPVWLAFGPSLNYSGDGFLGGSGEPGA
mgnify:CR=1 FL=1